MYVYAPTRCSHDAHWTPASDGTSTTSRSRSVSGSKRARCVFCQAKSQGSGPVLPYCRPITSSESPVVVPAPSQCQLSGSLGGTNEVGASDVPPATVVSVPRCSTTNELLRNGTVVGRLRSSLTGPQNVSEKSQAV